LATAGTTASTSDRTTLRTTDTCTVPAVRFASVRDGDGDCERELGDANRVVCSYTGFVVLDDRERAR
jgi:hypothetical protein